MKLSDIYAMRCCKKIHFLQLIWCKIEFFFLMILSSHWYSLQINLTEYVYDISIDLYVNICCANKELVLMIVYFMYIAQK